MCRPFLALALFLSLLVAASRITLRAAESSSGESTSRESTGTESKPAEPLPAILEGMEHVFVNVTKRERPSDEEWQALHEEPQRGGWLGGLADLNSKTIAF